MPCRAACSLRMVTAATCNSFFKEKAMHAMPRTDSLIHLSWEHIANRTPFWIIQRHASLCALYNTKGGNCQPALLSQHSRLKHSHLSVVSRLFAWCAPVAGPGSSAAPHPAVARQAGRCSRGSTGSRCCSSQHPWVRWQWPGVV